MPYWEYPSPEGEFLDDSAACAPGVSINELVKRKYSVRTELSQEEEMKEVRRTEIGAARRMARLIQIQKDAATKEHLDARSRSPVSDGISPIVEHSARCGSSVFTFSIYNFPLEQSNDSVKPIIRGP